MRGVVACLNHPIDEQVHYLGDPGRGSVWEETIINCPPHIRLLAMSATIANATDLGGWMSQVHAWHLWSHTVSYAGFLSDLRPSLLYSHMADATG